MLNINLFSGIVLLVLAIPLIYQNPSLLAYFILFNVFYIGSNIAASLRKADLTLLGFISSALLGMVILSVGISYQGILYLVMAAFQFIVHSFVLKDRYLSELFGYPHFSVTLAEASLATLEANGATKLPYTADEHQNEREKLTTQNTNGIMDVEKDSKMAVISFNNIVVDLPDKTKQKKKPPKQQTKTTDKPSIKNDATTVDDGRDLDVLSLEKPPEPIAPGSYDPKEYSANIENEMKSDLYLFSENSKVDINVDDSEENRQQFNEKKETYSDFIDKKSILLADKNSEETNDIDLLF